MLQYIVPATGLLFTLENILWINIGVFVGSVFAAIPGLSVILCVILFLPVTYTMTAIPGMMFLLGIYCAGGYGGSVSAILINTPGTPHAAATMLDGHPLSEQGRTKAALKIALYASTFGGVFSALMLLFLGPQVAKIAAQLGDNAPTLMEKPVLAAEDFSFYQQYVPGVFFFLGVGDTAELHAPTFSFDDEAILPAGVEFLQKLLLL